MKPFRRLKRTGSHSSSATASSSSSNAPRLRLAIAQPGSTCALVEADSRPAGCFTTTSLVYDTLRSIADSDKAARRLRMPIPRFLFGHDMSYTPSPSQSGPSSPNSLGSTFSTIPSISRTVALDDPDVSYHTHVVRRASVSTTSPAPAFKRRPSRPSTVPPSPVTRHGAGYVGIDPALAAAEDASRLRIDCVCSMCGADGANFPRSARTGEVWCSRECRIASREKTRGQSAVPSTRPVVV
jgi:hypothetical protein